MAATFAATGKRVLILLGGTATGIGTWVYAQAVAAQAKTNELLMQSKGECEECGTKDGGDLVNNNSAEYWKKQTEFWKSAADKWKGSK